jgi:hypothetical protein
MRKRGLDTNTYDNPLEEPPNKMFKNNNYSPQMFKHDNYKKLFNIQDADFLQIYNPSNPSDKNSEIYTDYIIIKKFPIGLKSIIRNNEFKVIKINNVYRFNNIYINNNNNNFNKNKNNNIEKNNNGILPIRDLKSFYNLEYNGKKQPSLLGEGSYGKVYKAIEKFGNKRECAIKKIKFNNIWDIIQIL